jgi:hypothetical protein
MYIDIQIDRYVYTCVCMYFNTIYIFIYSYLFIYTIGQTRISSAPLNSANNNHNDKGKNDDTFYEINYNISGSNRLSMDIKKQIKMKNKFENYVNNKYNNTMFKNKNQYKRNVSTNIYLDGIDQGIH